jgi:hypothetical protein
MKRTFLALALPLTLALGAAGCGSAGTEPPAQSAQAATRAPLETKLRGPLALFGEAVADVPLRAEQRAAIEKLAQEAKARHEALSPMRKEIALALADQVDAGSIDEAALAPKVDAAAAQWSKVQAEDRRAFEALHALLDADQRAAFANAVEARASEHRGRFLGRLAGKGVATNAAEGAAPAADRARARGDSPDAADFLPMHRLTKELDLTPAQQTTLFELVRAEWKEHDRGEVMSKVAEWHARHERILTAFRTDHFALDELAPADGAEKHAREMLTRGARFLRVALPVLTEEQRHTAAKLIRDRAAEDRSSAKPSR